jgi:protein O-mannosyl-transferase
MKSTNKNPKTDLNKEVSGGLWERVFLKGWHPYAWIAALGFLLYARTLFFGWTYFDDDHLVLLNSANIGSFKNLLLAFKTDVDWQSPGFYYRPVLTASLMFDAFWGGLRPLAFHAGNLAQHIVASCLVLALFNKLGCRPAASFLSALAFAVHPMSSQAVAWIPGRNDLLLGIFALISFLSFMKYLELRRWRWYGLSLIFFALAIFNKEAALAIPLICSLYVLLFAREKKNSRSSILLLAGWAGVIACFALARSAVVYGGVVKFNGLGDNLIGLISYAGKALFPVNLSVLPVPRDIALWPGLAALAILAVLFGWGGAEDRKRFIFGLGWSLFFLLPLALRGAGFAYYLEQRIYLPLMGFLLMFQESRLFHRPGRGKLLTASALLFTGLLAFTAWRHTGVFKDDLSFWQSAVRTSPHAYFAHTVLGQRYEAHGQPEPAEREFQKSLELNPGDPLVENDLGLILMEQGKLPEAEKAFISAISRVPNDPDMRKNLGLVYMKQGDWAGAEAQFRAALTLASSDPEIWDRLALVCYLQKKYAEAAGFYAQAINAGEKPDPRIMKILAPYFTKEAP